MYHEFYTHVFLQGWNINSVEKEILYAHREDWKANYRCKQASVSNAWNENKKIHTTSPRALVPTTCHIYRLRVLFSLWKVPAISPWHVLQTVIPLRPLEAHSLLTCTVGMRSNRGIWQVSEGLIHMSHNGHVWCHQLMCLQSSQQQKLNKACLPQNLDLMQTSG